MSYDQPSSTTASIVQGCGSRESPVSSVIFNIDGQSIGGNAASLSTMIGRSVKNNIPPSFDIWSNVPDVMKEKVWDIVTTRIEKRMYLSLSRRRIGRVLSTYAAQEKSKRGKAARQAMRCPHTFGRKGQARVADELRQKNLDKEITRTNVWLETHTKKDGSASCEEIIRKT